MNIFKRLQIEYGGIYGVISDYTSEANIMNYLTKLKEGIDNGDFDTIIYSIDEIIKWYRLNLSEINANPYVIDYNAHWKNCKTLEEIREELKAEDCVASMGKQTKTNGKMIFLSHRSSDKKYADALRNFIVGLGVKNDQLIYTSHPLHKIPMDENIYDYLRKNITFEIFMIILWSDDYLESPACLNEMGAVWVTQSDYTNIYVPTFDFGNPKYHECAVDTRKMGAVLNGNEHCKANLMELKNKIQALFNLENDEQNSAYLIDKFLEEIA